MALIKCAECGKEISSLATACPNCGCPIVAPEPEIPHALIKVDLPGYTVPVIIVDDTGAELWRGHDGEVAKIPVAGARKIKITGLQRDAEGEIAEGGNYEVVKDPNFRYTILLRPVGEEVKPKIDLSRCPHCGSATVFQTVEVAKKASFWTILLYIILFFTVLGILILIPLILKKKTETVTYAVCQKCGYKVRV